MPISGLPSLAEIRNLPDAAARERLEAIPAETRSAHLDLLLKQMHEEDLAARNAIISAQILELLKQGQLERMLMAMVGYWGAGGSAGASFQYATPAGTFTFTEGQPLPVGQPLPTAEQFCEAILQQAKLPQAPLGEWHQVLPLIPVTVIQRLDPLRIPRTQQPDLLMSDVFLFARKLLQNGASAPEVLDQLRGYIASGPA